MESFTDENYFYNPGDDDFNFVKKEENKSTKRKADLSNSWK